MKRIVTLIMALVFTFALTACAEREQEDYAADYKIHTLAEDENGELHIDPREVSETVGYYNYTVGGTKVQLLAMRDNDGNAHVAFNTCRSCSPSPKAYFLQIGELLECQNCKNLFSAFEIGLDGEGCSPRPIEGIEIASDSITIPAASLQAMAPAFDGWEGPKE